MDERVKVTPEPVMFMLVPVWDLLGTPDTSLRGRKTLMARRVFRSRRSSSLGLTSSSSGERMAIYLEQRATRSL